MKYRVAVVDDESPVRRHLQNALGKEGYQTEGFADARGFWERMEVQPFHLVFLDIRLPDADGLELLGRLKARYQETEVIMITGYGSIDSAIEAMKRGAYHYLSKPFKLKQAVLQAGRALEAVELRRENRLLREAAGLSDPLQGLIGNSPAMQELFSMIRRVAAVDCNVLLQGESGTGKELVARAIHRLSPRRELPFVSFNCGGFTEELICSELFGHEKGAFTGAALRKIGLLESAHGGTVFLDEIGETPPSMQVRLLHVCQEKRILRVGGTKPIDLDIHIIAATNKDLKKAVLEGKFREDLFYRLNVVTLQLPPLRERRDDIPLLVAHFREKYSRPFGKEVTAIAPQAMEILMRYNFPGNVRELENIIQRAVALAEGDTIQVEDLPPDLQELEFDSLEGERLPTLEEMERRHIARVLAKTGQNKGLSCKILGLSRTTLWRKMKKYGLLGEDELVSD